MNIFVHIQIAQDECILEVLREIKKQIYNFNSTEYNEELFDLDNFKTKLLKEVKQNDNNSNSGVYKKGDGNEQPISTVKQLYSMCVNKGINQTYQGNYIRDLLVDDRTRFLYNTYIRGFKLIDCYCYRYDDIKQCYYAKYWKDIEHRRYILIKIHFINNEMFTEQYVRIFRKNIVVAAEWEMINDICVGNIFKNRQILILN